MKKALLFTILLTLLLLPALCLGQTGTIAGKVSIKNSGKALPNAAVYLSNSKTGIYTKNNGTFILKNVPAGTQTVTVNMIGYTKQSKEITVVSNETAVVNFDIAVEAIELSGISVNATRAVKRETPVAFTDLKQKDIVGKYTTEDVPLLLEGVPGLFSSGGGLGEGELRVRGFDQDKVQIMINGIPVNDPESQQVYWSNWTGLSSNVKSVQVQRGSGSSLYGSGAFGGSINIETIGVTPNPFWTLRSSGGLYSSPSEVADGKGNMVDFTPYNYNMLARYNSGNLYGGKFNYSIMAERKIGSSYQIGTEYNGWSFGADTQHLWGDHTVSLSLIAAPQFHNQARATTDLNLMESLGRNYNRNNNVEQENYYFKPQFSIRDEWKISEKSLLMANAFITSGTGGGRYLRNDKFDVSTGKVFSQGLSDYSDNKYFGRHALYVYENAGVMLEGFDAATDTTSAMYFGQEISKAANLPNSDYSHSWNNDSQNNHKQIGMNAYIETKPTESFKIVGGFETRYWRAQHVAETKDFRYNGGVYALAEDRYNYDGIVTNISVFTRAQWSPVENLNFMADAQYATYTSRVEENPIAIFDFGRGIFTGDYYFATQNKTNSDGSLKYAEEDYEKTYSFLSPKVGLNYNLTKYLNAIVNYSIAYKEPRVTDWYSRSDGPDFYQTDDDGNVKELDPEKVSTIEGGLAYEGIGWNVGVNYYDTKYEDKIEDTYLQNGERLTVNAGEANHSGIEFSAGLNMNSFDAAVSGTMAKNRWEKMNVDKIFGIDAAEIEDKVVPYSPEKMLNGSLGYTFELSEGRLLRLGTSMSWWDEYYASYSNTYDIYGGTETNDEGEEEEIWNSVEAKLPAYLAINADISYSFIIAQLPASIRLDLKNINNREDNYLRAYTTSDYGRNDEYNGASYMYVQPAPLFNAFLTVEVSF